MGWGSRLQPRAETDRSPPPHHLPDCFLQTAIRRPATKMKTICPQPRSPRHRRNHSLQAFFLIPSLTEKVTRAQSWGGGGQGRETSSLLRHLTPPTLIRMFPENKAGGQSGRGRAQAAGPRVPKQLPATGPPPPRQDPLSLSQRPPALLPQQTIRATNSEE